MKNVRENTVQSVLSGALTVTMIVGTISLLINQFDALVGEGELRIIPAVLSYGLPFSVFVIGKIYAVDKSSENECL